MRSASNVHVDKTIQTNTYIYCTHVTLIHSHMCTLVCFGPRREVSTVELFSIILKWLMGPMEHCVSHVGYIFLECLVWNRTNRIKKRDFSMQCNVQCVCDWRVWYIAVCVFKCLILFLNGICLTFQTAPPKKIKKQI